MSLRLGAWLGLSLCIAPLVGCQCGPADDAMRGVEPAVEPAAPEPPVGPADVPRARRADLPVLVPALTVEVTARGYAVSNRALVDSWPPPERAHAASLAPPDQPDFPVVEVDVPTIDPAPLLVPGLQAAMALAAEADRARAPGGGPRVFAVRAAPDVRWERVLRAIYAGGLTGYAEPWLVVRVGGAERTLRLAAEDEPTSAETRETIAAALAALGDLGGAGIELPASPDTVLAEAEAAAAPARLSLRLEEHGLRVRRGLVELGPDCRTPAADGSPALSSSSFDRERFAACLDALGPFDRARVEASPDLAYGSLVPVLEGLSGRGPIVIGMMSGPRAAPEPVH